MRTSAVIIMLLANSIPYYHDFNPSIICRMICSLAAPMFIFLSGFSAHFSKKNSKIHRYYPAFCVLIAAIFVDMAAWGVLPFVEYDVLYLISFGLLFNSFFQGKGYIQLFIAITILVLGPLALKFFDYRHEMIEFSIIDISLLLKSFDSLYLFKRFLFDGWFPLVPWLGFSLLGYFFFYVQEEVKRLRYSVLSASLIIFIFSFSLLKNITPMQTRNGYIELFYPPTYTYIFFAVSWILLLYCLTCSITLSTKSSNTLSLLGRRSLFVYIIHSFILSYVVNPFLFIENGVHFISFLLVLFIICFALCLLIEKSFFQMKIGVLPKILVRSLGL